MYIDCCGINEAPSDYDRRDLLDQVHARERAPIFAPALCPLTPRSHTPYNIYPLLCVAVYSHPPPLINGHRVFKSRSRCASTAALCYIVYVGIYVVRLHITGHSVLMLLKIICSCNVNNDVLSIYLIQIRSCRHGLTINVINAEVI